MLNCRSRGHSFTRALLGIAADELHLCGDPAAVSLIESILSETGDDLQVVLSLVYIWFVLYYHASCFDHWNIILLSNGWHLSCLNLILLTIHLCYICLKSSWTFFFFFCWKWFIDWLLPCSGCLVWVRVGPNWRWLLLYKKLLCVWLGFVRVVIITRYAKHSPSLSHVLFHFS